MADLILTQLSLFEQKISWFVALPEGESNNITHHTDPALPLVLFLLLLLLLHLFFRLCFFFFFQLVLNSKVAFPEPGVFAGSALRPLRYVTDCSKRRPGKPWRPNVWVACRFPFFLFFSLSYLNV